MISNKHQFKAMKNEPSRSPVSSSVLLTQAAIDRKYEGVCFYVCVWTGDINSSRARGL